MPKSRKKAALTRAKRKGSAGTERRSGKERRSGVDRRKVDIPVEVDRRKGSERRSPMDRRQCPLS